MNPARQFLHILFKDIRSHVPEIGIVLLLNVVLTLTLTQPWTVRLDETASSDLPETLIGNAAQVLLVLAWCALIGRVVQDDGAAGKAPYWLTRPYTRPALLASKLAFVLLFVHLPLFLSHLAIVTGSGLPLSLVQMLVDQAVLVVCLSLPVMALAALTSTFSRFLFGGVAVAAVASFVVAGGGLRISTYVIGAAFADAGAQYLPAIALAILASIAGVALVCQYRWRATLRITVASIVALSLFGIALLTPAPFFLLPVIAAVDRPETVPTTMRFRAAAEPRIVNPRNASDPRLVMVPIDVIDAGATSMSTSQVDIRTAAGREVEFNGDDFDTGSGVGLRRNDDGDWLLLYMSQSDYDSLKDDVVSLHFIADFWTYDIRELEPIPRDFSFAIVGGRAQCGIPGGRAPFTCRTSFGLSIWSFDPARGEAGTAVYELLLPVRLRFAINPITTQASGNSEVATVLRRRVSYTRQDVTFENIRLGDWGP